MWPVTSITTGHTRIDLTSSGQGPIDATRVDLDGVLFANAVERTDWDGSVFQVVVCEGCGFEGCQNGAWLAARRAGEYVLFLPAFDLMEREPDSGYSPPEFAASRGLPLLARPFYEGSLRAVVPDLPEARALKPLLWSELKRILQWEAPLGMLGAFPVAPRVQAVGDVLAVSGGTPEQRLAELQELLAGGDAKAEVLLRPKTAADMELTFYLDHPVHPEWSPLVVSQGRIQALLAPGLVAEV